MSTLAEMITPERAVTPSTPHLNPDCAERLVEHIRAEYREMPGLSLTLAQAARVLGTDIRHSKRLLMKLLAEGLLVRDARGAFRRRDVWGEVERPAVKPARWPKSAVDNGDIGDHRSPTMSMPSEADVLEALGVELPCLACERSYRISLRKIRLSQGMMDAGCQVRHFSDCPPAAFAHLIDSALLAEFEEGVEKVAIAAEGAGGRLVGPR